MCVCVCVCVSAVFGVFGDKEPCVGYIWHAEQKQHLESQNTANTQHYKHTLTPAEELQPFVTLLQMLGASVSEKHGVKTEPECVCVCVCFSKLSGREMKEWKC